jgi:hypothetical protein
MGPRYHLYIIRWYQRDLKLDGSAHTSTIGDCLPLVILVGAVDLGITMPIAIPGVAHGIKEEACASEEGLIFK